MYERSGPVARVLSLFLLRKRTAALLVVLVLLAAAFDITVPFVTQRLIDALIRYFQHPAGNPVRLLVFSAAAILAATVLARVVKSLYDYLLFKTVTQLEDVVRFRAIEKYLNLHALFHHRSNSGQIIGRIERGCGSIYCVLFDLAGQSLLPPILVFAGVLATLLYKNPWIALTVILPPPLYWLASRHMTERIYAVEQEANEAFETVSKEAYDVAGNVMTVKKFSQESAEAAHQRGLVGKARLTQYSVVRLWAILENTQNLVAVLGRVSVIALGGLLVIRKSSTVGEFVLYVTLQGMAYQPISQLSIIFPRLRREMTRVERIFGLLDEPEDVVDAPGATAMRPFAHDIEFRNVWFRYGEDKRWILRGLNLKIPAGATVALVGRSGSGKTTFVNLLLRAFDPQQGSILIDGIDIRQVTKASLREQMAVVPQEVDLFSRTVSENIGYGKAGATREEIERAARTALAHDFILNTECGYETLVGERGLKLSGGERQRIGIARAVLRDPAILIFDEATSHLDTESEQLIQRATDRLAEGRTVFLIAHRLSTVLRADRIVVFNDGGIEAVGTHEELAHTSPTYRKLYSIQFGRVEREEEESELVGS